MEEKDWVFFERVVVLVLNANAHWGLNIYHNGILSHSLSTLLCVWGIPLLIGGRILWLSFLLLLLFCVLYLFIEKKEEIDGSLIVL